MSCDNPLYALRLPAINPETGKQMIKVLPRREGDDYFSLCRFHGQENIIPLPCGKCPSCIEARSKAWALRCVCEASLYDRNCFLTLTYNDKCCPKGLCRKDVQKFIKALRYEFPDHNIRYFGCGEYGEHTKRPHYHLIIFGLFPDDAKMATIIKNNFYYTSKRIQKCWSFGFITVTDCTYASCAYVARYCQKKLKNPDKREFSMMSLKPGIGYDYFLKNKDFIYRYDAIIGNFGRSLKQRPSRYFDKMFEMLSPESFQLLKEKRISTANSQVVSEMICHRFEYYEQLLGYKAKIKSDKMSLLKRKDL